MIVRLFAFLAFLGIFGVRADAGYAQPLPAEDFGNLPAIMDAAISPDGRVVALAMGDIGGGRPGLALYSLDGDTRPTGLALESDTQLRAVGWNDDNLVTFLLSRTFQPNDILPPGVIFRGSPRRVEYWRHGVYDRRTKKSEVLVINDEQWAEQSTTLISPIEGDPGYGRIIARSRYANDTRSSIFRVNLTNSNARTLSTEGENAETVDYLLGANGAPLLRYDRDDRTNGWKIFVYESDRPRLLEEGSSATGNPPWYSGRLADGRLVRLEFDQQSGLTKAIAKSLDTNTSEVIAASAKYDIDSVEIDPWSRNVVGVRWVEDEVKQKFFDQSLQAAQAAIAAHFTDAQTELRSWSRDRTRLLVYSERGLDGGQYWVFDTREGKASSVGYLYPNLAATGSGSRQSITYPARDRTRIPAYLTLPPRVEAKQLPIVVLVHGGPSARDDLRFDWWAAFLASRGYAVLQPNFRGSSGYGEKWETAGWGEWGGLMQTDVEDGVAALIRAGVADPARVCIVGASYGGYAALAGATMTPERYRCAIGVAGVYDLNAFVRERAAQFGKDSATADYWRLSIGDKKLDQERLDAKSPVNLAASVRGPILLLHGTDDSVVPIIQSRRMEQALQRAGKSVRFVVLPRDDHWLSDASTRITMLKEIEAFLAQNLAPPPP